MTFDPHEIANALTSRGVSVDCPACENGELEVLTSEYALIVPASEHMLIGHRNAKLALAASGCPNCGYVQLHATKMLEPGGKE